MKNYLNKRNIVTLVCNACCFCGVQLLIQEKDYYLLYEK